MNQLTQRLYDTASTSRAGLSEPVDLEGLRDVAHRGGKVWRGLLWNWSVGLLRQIEEGHAFVRDENIELSELSASCMRACIRTGVRSCVLSSVRR